jgi:cytochrome c biogenesis protein ResB
MPNDDTIWSVLLSPPVLVTFIVCALLFGGVAWLMNAWHRRQRERLLADQRGYQEATVERLLDSVATDKDQLIAQYEATIRERDDRIAALEGTVSRLRDRLSSSGIMGLFGGKQRDVVGALLLENEQLHELLLEKQEQLRKTMADMTGEILARMDEQTRASAQAVRYKQALLSAFLQHEEARQVLDRMIAEGRLTPGPQAAPEERPASESPSPAKE